jgi:exopolyphosphatase/guanosine-5'-triphosphate,3'-diphosphate pyrophosphatase
MVGCAPTIFSSDPAGARANYNYSLLLAPDGGRRAGAEFERRVFTRHPMRLAAIDIGTNSVHMIVVQVRPDLSFEVIDREKEMVRLGAGGLDGRRITDTAEAAALTALGTFRRVAESHHVDEILAAATSATREAANGPEFLAAIARETGIRPRVISGTEEARLIHLAALYSVESTGRPIVVIDIGGGSVEITLGASDRPDLAQSFKLGVIRLTEKHVASDPLSPRDERRLVAHVTRTTGHHLAAIVEAGFDRVVGTSGTILSLGALAVLEAEGHAPGDLRNLRVDARDLHRLRKRLTSLPLAERLRMPGMEPRRADIAVAGSVLLDTLLRKLGARDITLSDLALREGLVLDYIRRNRPRIAQVDAVPDARRRSVIELADRCGVAPEHAQQVARLALSLFDQSAPVHGLGQREREWLEYAALVHDVGAHISYERHHQHSYYLITNGDLRGFEPLEIQVLALVARYHRRGTPKKSHEAYGALPGRLRRTVRCLAAILRLAEGLDRSHAQPLESVTLVDRGDDVMAALRASGDAELELWAAGRHAGPFEGMLGKTVRFEVRS